MEVQQLALLAWPLVSAECYRGWLEGRGSVEQVDSAGRMTIEEERGIRSEKIMGRGGQNGREERESPVYHLAKLKS